MFDDIFSQVSPDTVTKNIKRQATKILKDIAVAYSEGLMDSPESAFKYCSLLACICEGKVEGVVDDAGMVKWSLTKEYAEKLEIFKDHIASSDTNVIRGPWVS